MKKNYRLPLLAGLSALSILAAAPAWADDSLQPGAQSTLGAGGPTSKTRGYRGQSPGTSAEQEQSQGKMTDGQIVKVLETANQSEIDGAKVAQKNTKNKDIKEYARHMMTEHKKVNQEAKKLSKKSKIKPQESDDSRSLKEDSEKAISEFKSKKGSDFDKSYIDAQVKNHEELLKKIDDDLLPNAKSPELKAMLQKVRPDVAGHLEEAKRVQESLKQTA